VVNKLKYSDIVNFCLSNELKLISEDYVNNKTPLLIKCKFGHVFKRPFNNLVKNTSCPFCEKLNVYNNICAFIALNGFELLTEFSEYKNTNQALKLRCKNGHTFSRSYFNFKHNPTCPICKLENIRVGIDVVRSKLAVEGYKVLSTTYTNNKTKLKLKCPVGHICYISYNHFMLGVRCKRCRKDKEWTYTRVKKYIESFGDKLLSKEYISSKHKLTIRCKNGHIYKIKFNDYRNGHRCAVCAGNKKLTYESVKHYITQHGYTLLSKSYVNSQTKLVLKCPHEHVYEATFSKFKSGHRCPKCAIINKRYSQKYVEEQLNKEGYELLTNYVNSRTPIKVKCPKGHIYETKWNYFQSGNRCPKCYTIIPKAEKEIFNYLKNLGHEVELHNRSILYNTVSGRYLELDLFIVDLCKAIEFNGEYWHNNDETVYRDELKIQLSLHKNLDLLIIKENAWKFDVSCIYRAIDKFIEDKLCCNIGHLVLNNESVHYKCLKCGNIILEV